MIRLFGIPGAVPIFRVCQTLAVLGYCALQSWLALLSARSDPHALLCALCSLCAARGAQPSAACCPTLPDALRATCKLACLHCCFYCGATYASSSPLCISRERLTLQAAGRQQPAAGEPRLKGISRAAGSRQQPAGHGAAGAGVGQAPGCKGERRGRCGKGVRRVASCRAARVPHVSAPVFPVHDASVRVCSLRPRCLPSGP